MPRVNDKMEDLSIRLNKFIANAGVCSRREADFLIERGLVKVNGKVVKELGLKVNPDDKVEYDGNYLVPEKPIYLLMNKPKNCITTKSDPQKRATVMDRIDPEYRNSVFPVGRLDRNTTGVLMLTNDGDLANALTHPKLNIDKIYMARLDKVITKAHMEQLVAGVELEDGLAVMDKVAFIDPNDKSKLGVEIHMGKNRIVRRMFGHLGYEVEALDRVSFGGLTKKNVMRGNWRVMEEKEVRLLKARVGIKTGKLKAGSKVESKKPAKKRSPKRK